MTYPAPLTRPEREHIRAEIDKTKRARLGKSHARLVDPDRDPHPRRDYWREYKHARKQAAA